MKNVRQIVKTGRSFSIPRWASFILMSTRVIVSPLYLGPVIVAAIGFAVGLEQLGTWAVMTSAFALMWVGAATGFAAKWMREDGVIEDYLSMLYQHSHFGRYLAAHFASDC